MGVIGAIDQGTSSTRCLLFSTNDLSVLASHQIELPHITPKDGWVEMDPVEMVEATRECMRKATQALLQRADYNSLDQILGLGVTNQRETTVVWDRTTGRPLYNAIVWLDSRTSHTVDAYASLHENGKDAYRDITGLPLSPYFSALKIHWLIEHVPEVKAAMDEGTLMAGWISLPFQILIPNSPHLPLSPYFSALKIHWLIEHAPEVKAAMDEGTLMAGWISLPFQILIPNSPHLPLSPYFSALKIHWLIEHVPEVKAAMDEGTLMSGWISLPFQILIPNSPHLPLSPYFSALKIHWLIEHVPEVKAAMDEGTLMAGWISLPFQILIPNSPHLPLSPYFSALKIHWLIEHVPEVKAAMDEGTLMAGWISLPFQILIPNSPHLPLSPYFSALKIHWLIEHVPEVKAAMDEGTLMAGWISLPFQILIPNSPHLPLSPYFSALKIHWLIEHVPEVKAAMDEGTLMAGWISLPFQILIPNSPHLPLSPYFSALKIHWLIEHVPEVKAAMDEGTLMAGWISLPFQILIPNSPHLPLSPYFSALKIHWLIEHVPEVKAAMDEGTLMAGTVDTWLIWNLTGGVNGGAFVTDVTNASRTMLMNINTLDWDDKMLHEFRVSRSSLPAIRSSAEEYGRVAGPADELGGKPITGCLGDQQSALVGHACLSEGMAKNTYGTGCFMLYNTGNKPVISRHGLLTTVAFKLGPQAEAFYALEGSIAVAGAAVRWLRDQLGIINDASEIEALAEKAKPSGTSLVFVPALTGLYAPHWDPTARGAIFGLNFGTGKAEIARATLEAVAWQTKEVLDAMVADSGVLFSQALRVDGGMTVNNLLLRIQADSLNVEVLRPRDAEKTALGAAAAAGIALGVWTVSEFGSRAADYEAFSPSLGQNERDEYFRKWKTAVERSKGWTNVH